MNEIQHMFIFYIESQECFRDPRNKDIYEIENSKLQETINMKAFHKGQIGELIQTKIRKRNNSENFLEVPEVIENILNKSSVKDSNSSFFNNCQTEKQISENSESQIEFDIQSLSSCDNIRPIQVV